MILKLKRTPGIYLVGFMASGKTTIGGLLAEELGWSFADLDEDIETTHGAAIHDIFKFHGEAKFREIESAALERRVTAVQYGRPTVIALGGGTFTEQRNFEMIDMNGIAIWLDCPLSRAKERIANTSHRPLARDPQQFEHLFHHRQSAYQRAHYRVPIEADDPIPVIQAILNLPIFI